MAEKDNISTGNAEEKKDKIATEAVSSEVKAAAGADAAAPADGNENKEEPAVSAKRAKSGRVVPSGIAVINATFNNTKVTFTDLHGNTLCWSSGGKMGMKGSRKSTAYAAQMVAADAAKKAQTLGMREVEVKIKGPGAGRESAVRGIVAAGLEITALKDITPVPHNGCRPPKRRRV
jgi:small subunit ribosomal protein S11